jgi:hypothetical protein
VTVTVCPEIIVPEPERAIETVGAVVSTRCDKLAEIKAFVNVALLDDASRIVPPFADNVFVVTEIPLVSLSPETTV